MPKSKRNRVVHLSQVDKKGKELSERLFNNVREAADSYQYIFVFSVENMRNTYLKDVRAELSDSRYVKRARHAVPRPRLPPPSSPPCPPVPHAPRENSR
jgi:hypothetical protein